MKTVHSSSITFMDTTDSRKLEVYITSNLPTCQIYNPNTGEYSPDWTVANLTLTTDVFLDSNQISNASIVWYKKIGSGTKTQLSTNTILTISTNELSGSNSIITYICEVEYQGLAAQDQITFTRTDTGQNGADGTSVTIDGTAYYNGTLTASSIGTVVSLYSDEAMESPIDTSLLSSGDSYIVQGYLCIYSESDNGFICSGTIQGPKGEDAKSVILNGDSQVFKVSKTNVITPATITVTAQTTNTSVSTWTYSTNGGQTFLSTVPNGITQNGSTVTITGSSITSNIIVIKASDGTYSDTFTIYKVFDGADGLPGDSGDSAPIAFLTNENITFSANAQGQITGTTVTTDIAAYDGETKVTPAISTITGIPDGMSISTDDIITVNNELVLSIVIEDNATFGTVDSTSGTISIPVTSPISTVLSLSWSKINTGATGDSGTDAITFQVYSSNGYVLSKENPSITLNTFAYSGDTAITSGATYQWYILIDGAWEAISGATNAYYEIVHSDVSYSASYMCDMTFNGISYVDVVTVDDKHDTNTVYTSQPDSYSAGDVWVVGIDYIPSKFEVGTVLKAQYSNDTYSDEDWILATKYDEQLMSLETDISNYKQYISLDVNKGIKMTAIDQNGNASKFSTTLSNTQLSFNEDDEAVAYINNHKMHITEAEVISPLTITGEYSGSTMLQAPVLNIGSFSLIVESNGSLSIVSNI